MNREKKIHVLESVLGPKHGSGDELVFFCPNHGSRPGRTVGQLSVNVKTDFFHCWSCGFGGKNLVPIFKIKKLFEVIKEYTEEFRVTKKEEKKFSELIVPEEFLTLSRPTKSPYFSSAMSYLSERGVTREDVLRMKLGYCEEGEYKYRIVFLSFDEFGSLNYVTGRSFFDSSLKYLNGNYSKDIVFNDYLIDWSMSVTIVEGPFDSIKAGKNSIPFLGNHFLDESSRLFLKIISQQDRVYLALDPDARDMQLEIAEKLLAYGVKSSLVPVTKKDVGEMSREEFDVAKKQSLLVESVSDLLKLRVHWV